MNDQPRTPAGSPAGGQFGSTPGAEANGSLSPAAGPVPTNLEELISRAATMTTEDVKTLVAAGASKYNRWSPDNGIWRPFDDEYTWELLEVRYPETDSAAFDAGFSAYSAARSAEAEHARGWVGYSGRAADAVKSAAEALVLEPLMDGSCDLFPGGRNEFDAAVSPVRALWPDLFPPAAK